jgi:hypothetical protein
VSAVHTALSSTHEDPHNATIWSALQTALCVPFLAADGSAERTALDSALRTANETTLGPAFKTTKHPAVVAALHAAHD